MRSPHLLAFWLAVAALLASAAPAPARQPLRTNDPVTQALDGLASGAPTPVANRPHRAGPTLHDRLTGATSTARPAAFVEPNEFGVAFLFDGTRAELEAAGIRVQTQAGRLFTARLHRDDIARLRAVPGIRSARLQRFLRPHLNVSLPDVRADLEHAASGSPPVYAGRAGQGMLIGDVDTGIDWTRPDFNDASGKTRVLYIWDQTDVSNGGPSPAGFGYGTEWTKANIDNSPGTVRATDTDGHGTSVAGVLIGNGSLTGCSMPAYRFVGMAPLANFIEVATDYSNTGIIDGVNYIFQKADSLGMDCVVNLSLGSQYGPHDGSDPYLTQAISALTGPGHIVVASAGNNQQDGIHGRLTTTSLVAGTDKITFTIPTYTPTGAQYGDYVLITGWYDPGASLTLRVKGPNAGDTLSVGFGNAKDRNLTTSAGKGGKLFVANQNAYWGYDGSSTLRQFEVEIYDSLATSAPRPGTWEIDPIANGTGSIGARVDVWIYDASFGSTGLASAVVTGLDATTLVAEPADGDSVIAVGAHATKVAWTSCSSGACGFASPPTVGAIASFSDVGPRRDGVLKPELTAPGFGVATTWSSQVGMTTCEDADDGQHGMTLGTSFSAPHVAGAAALFMQYQPHASPSRIRQSFEAHARPDAYTGVLPNPTWGYGKLDVYSTIDHVAPTCAMTSPAGGESWIAATTHTVTWTAADNVAVTAIDLAYSVHGAGGPWVAIVTGIANSGSARWTLPPAASDSAFVRVTAHDAGANQASAQSAARFHITTPAGVGPDGPAVFWLAPPAPNPSGRAVILRFSLSRPGDAAVEVFGVHGERVWSANLAGLPAGEHAATWSGAGAAGRRAGAGLYFVRLTTAEGVRTARLIRYE